MDSLTQLALGAAVGGAVMGRRHGAKAFAWGAVIGTLPDLDSFVDYGSPVADFTYHRGYSHALLVQTLAAPLLAWLINRLHRGDAREYRGWLLATWLALVTHALLDAFTVYGTQLALPLSDYPYGIGSIFIIDPLYTLPLLLGVLGAILLRRRWGEMTALRWNTIGLIVSSGYLAWTLAAQQWVLKQAHEALAEAGITSEHVLVTPTPFNSLLWRIVAVTDDVYYEGFQRVGAADPPQLHAYRREPALLADIDDAWAVRRLQYFTKGFYGVERHREATVITDLRMGVQPYFSFAFEVGHINGNGGVSVTEPARQIRIERPPLGEVFDDLIACGTGAASMHIQC